MFPKISAHVTVFFSDVNVTAEILHRVVPLTYRQGGVLGLDWRFLKWQSMTIREEKPDAPVSFKAALPRLLSLHACRIITSAFYFSGRHRVTAQEVFRRSVWVCGCKVSRVCAAPPKGLPGLLSAGRCALLYSTQLDISTPCNILLLLWNIVLKYYHWSTFWEQTHFSFRFGVGWQEWFL